MSSTSQNENKIVKRKIPEIKTKLKRFDRLTCCFFLFAILVMIGFLVAFVLVYQKLDSHHEVNWKSQILKNLNLIQK